MYGNHACYSLSKITAIKLAESYMEQYPEKKLDFKNFSTLVYLDQMITAKCMTVLLPLQKKQFYPRKKI